MGKRGTWVIAAVIPKYLSPRLLCPRDYFETEVALTPNSLPLSK